ncbi:MAG: valine--tRNA ligase [Chitinophagales bacterium]|nr:valine--tRNA ligase [Chitinophagales bacterium]MDW8419114.1 valine--tRNA ligase [Chitinophagales bacterium]
MSIPKTYSPAETESRWYAYWMQHEFFRSVPDEREPFAIVIPPPNVTGVLHMGHMLNNTIQDILIRRARMQGKNACWVPGTDHASIATEAKVVQMLREKGIKKSDLTRDEFLQHAFAWKEKYGGIILEQLKKLGASCDWKRTRFTMEDSLSEAVIDAFIHLYRKGYLYRDLKMVNWDPVAKTTLSNEEVNYEEQQSTLFYVKYLLKDSDEYIPVATVRPETIMGDVAVCVHPQDERYKHLIGKTVIVPLVRREVPVIADEYVDMEFGTGALKITPAHDIHDYEIGKKYNLPIIDCFNDDGTLSEAAQVFVGVDRFEARRLAASRLAEEGLLIKTETITNKVGLSERTNAVVEPRLSMQWFVRMDELIKPALENVMNDNIRFYPERFKNLYKHWLENLRDWPISRQLWWGQRIPAWYAPDGTYAVAKTRQEAFNELSAIIPNLKPDDLRQDEDVVDTWFSSWLWPISVFDGFKDPNNPDIRYYYPTTVLVTGWDIIFFWVARMIIAGYEFRGEKPFHKVYFTGMVRDKLRRKMSKSLGNSPDTLELLAQYGADGVRFGVMSASAAGNDLLYDDKQPEQGRNFCNKMWNALRLVKGWEVAEGNDTGNQAVLDWMNARLHQAITELDKLFDEFRLSEALMLLYKLIWDEFCSWYLELIKPEYGKPIDQHTYQFTIGVFDTLMRLLHPFMPFITEEIWQHLAARKEGESICVASYPVAEAGAVNSQLLQQANLAFEMITAIREIRAKAGKKNTETVDVYYEDDGEAVFAPFANKIKKLARVNRLEPKQHELKGAKTFIVGGCKFYVWTGEATNTDEERARLEKELEYVRGFLASVEKKLSNERFVSSAPPAVVEGERRKKADALHRIQLLEETLRALSG